MIKNKKVLFLLFIVFVSCNKQVRLDHEFYSNEIFLVGKMDVNFGVEVYLTKTFSPLEAVAIDTLDIPDAEVVFFRGNDSIGQLIYNSNAGCYQYLDTENLLAGEYYWVDVKVSGYSNIFSDPVKLLEIPEVEISSLELSNNPDSLSTLRIAELTINLDDAYAVDNMYYLKWLVGSENEFTENQIAIKNGVILSCPTTFDTYLFDYCFDGVENVPITFTSSYNDYSMFVNDTFEYSFSTVSLDTTIFQFQSIDSLGMKNILSQNSNLFSDYQPSIPAITFSNMSNGLGIFYSVSSKEFILSSP